jgi:hypothetical protein
MNEEPTDIADLMILRSTELKMIDRLAALRRLIGSPTMTAGDKETLAREMLNDASPQIVSFAGWFLLRADVNQQDALAALREASRSQPNKHARWAIIELRAKAGDATVLQECLPVLDPNHEEFDHALWALSALGTAEALSALRDAFARFPNGKRKDSIVTIYAMLFAPVPEDFVDHLEQRLEELSGKACHQWTPTESRIVAVLARQGNSLAIGRFRDLIARWRMESQGVEQELSIRIGIGVRSSRDDEDLPTAVEEWLKLHG